MPSTFYKPAGLPVFPPHGEPQGDCVLARLLINAPWRGEVDWPEGFAGGIAHRLDNATSGALLLADSLQELSIIRDHFANHRFLKRYVLRSLRDVPWDENNCDKPIAHHPRKGNRMVVQRGNATPHRGKWYPARTDFRRLGRGIFEATMRSGLMHQIRVHAAFVGIAIAGDRLYGGGELPAALADPKKGTSTISTSLSLESPQRQGNCGCPLFLPQTFLLHHRSLTGPNGLTTQPVDEPTWISL